MIKRICFPQVGNKVAYQLFGGIKRKTGHGTRYIQNENIFSRRNIFRLTAFRRLYHQHKDIFIVVAVHQESGLNRFSGELVIEYKIAVARIVIRVCQRYMRFFFIPVDIDIMRAA